ncbi:MAG TPA: hypothetical protein VFL76_01755 [Edaphocola sp.]|nr:hypothetical protein [Edaphocola sp.]
MQKIEIKAKAFFEKIKGHDLSMWDMLAQLIKDEEQEIVFTGEDGNVLLSYILPTNIGQLMSDQKAFAQLLAEQMAQRN